MTLARRYGEFAHELDAAAVPAAAWDTAKSGFVDTLGTLLAGAGEPVVQRLRAALAPLPPGEARLLLGDERCAAGEAALINGTAAHALDYDDVAMHAHPSTVLVPAIVALGQAVRATGQDMLLAYIAGYETWADMNRREPQLHHERGWHPTGVLGAVAAAVACARLLGLNAAQIAHAACIGASQGAGLTANFGSMTKPFHAGRAAQAGVVSARLAQQDFTAKLDAIEHPRGFLAALSPSGQVDLASPAAVGEPWQIVESGLNIKRYPTCYCTHRGIDAALELRARDPAAVDAGRIARIEVLISQEHYRVLLNHEPKTALEAKFSIEFAVAAALLRGNVGLMELADDVVLDPALQALMRKVHVRFATEYAVDNPGYALFDQVWVETAGGAVLASEPVRHARGNARLPLLPQDRRAKFLDCAAFGASRIDAAALFSQLDALERLADARTLGEV